MEQEKLENFDKFAHEYKSILDKSLKYGGESGDYFTRYKANYIQRNFGKDFKGRMLDYGCGIGLLSDVLVKYFPQARVDGFDVSVASIEHLPSPLKAQGLFTSDINLLMCDYDLIVVANVLHHIEPVNRQEAITRLRSLVKPDGKIIIFEHNPVNPLTRKIVKDSPLDKGVILLPSLETYTYLIKAGFRNSKINYIVFFPKVLNFLRWAEPYLSWCALGGQYTVTGEINDDA